MIVASLLALTAAALVLLWSARRPADGPWSVGRMEVVALRFGDHTVTPADVDMSACGLARSDVLDAIEEGRSGAERVPIDRALARVDPGDRLEIERHGGAREVVWVGRSAPVGGRTYVRVDESIWAVHGDLRRAMEDVDANCQPGEPAESGGG